MYALTESIRAPQESLWEATAAPGPKLESIGGGHTAEVVVIGAGVAGLSTALHLAEAGCSVTVLEAKEPGAGATGDSGGLLAPDFIRHSPAEIEKLLGRTWGGRLTHMVGSCAKQCFDLIEKYGISCDANQDGFWVPAHNELVLESLQKRGKEWQEAGFRVECVSEHRTIESLGTENYCGAIRFAEGGSLNPLAFCRGLAEAAIKHGATIFSHSPVEQVSRHENGWRVFTANGFVDAERIVLAANGGNASLHEAMQRTVLPLKVFEYATAPLAPEQRASILPEGGSFTDKQSYIFTARYDESGRLIAAFPEFLAACLGERRLYSEASRRLAAHFPILKGISVQFLWRGTAWLNPSLLPKVYDLREGIFAIQACNGRGLATNTVLGKEMAAALLARNEEKLSVQLETPTRIRAHRLLKMAPSVLMGLAYLNSRVRGLEARRAKG